MTCQFAGTSSGRQRACKRDELPLQRIILSRGCRREGASALRVRDSQSAVEAVRKFYRDAAQESIIVMCLASTNEVMNVIEVSLGGLASAPADPRVIFGGVISSGAPAFILFHNHPSGDPEPSDADEDLTRLVLEGSRTFSLRMLDHIIVGQPGYYSFAEHGKLR